MRFRKPLLAASVILLGLGSLPSLPGQGPLPPAQAAVGKARALYYTPVDNGLQGFRCEVTFDWKSFIQRASNQPVPDNDERLKYLDSIQLSVEDTLRGTGELHWNAPSPPPEKSEESVGRIREGIQQVWSGFFQSWNGYLTGDLVTLDSKAVAERTAEGFHVAVRTGSSLAEERFDSGLVLTSVHVTTPTLDSTVLPTFSHGPRGLLVSSIQSSYRQPPSAAPTGVTMNISYLPVDGFELPSQLIVTAGPAVFDFHLGQCTVQTQITPR